MKKKLGGKFWAAMLIFGLAGQVAWIVENMYLNVFLYKMFHASAADIARMVGASSVAATLTTILAGAFSDWIGRRKLLICLGYLAWGVTILGFGFVRVDLLTPAAGSTAQAMSLGVSLVIVLDCVMTFFGSAANDAGYNAWLTDWGEDSQRGKIEGFNSMMPMVAILVVFGGFMGFSLDEAGSWTVIFCIIGGLVLAIGVLGFFLIEESPRAKKQGEAFWATILYSFRLSVFKENRLLYAALGAFAIFGISIQTYMPYLILYYEKSLGLANYVLIMAPAIVLAAVVTALYGKVYDMCGFRISVMPAVGLLMAGYGALYVSRATLPVFFGSLLMMSGYLMGMAVFGAMIRDHIPQSRAGQFQGIRIIAQALIPGVLGPALGAWVLQDAQLIQNSDGTYSFLPNANIFLAALVVAAVLCGALFLIFSMVQRGHYELSTEAGERLGREAGAVWQEHPRPQLRRELWQSLNGNWHLRGEPVRVPFPPQSALSGYGKRVRGKFVCEKRFFLRKDFVKERTLLHFGAVDQVAEVTLNGKALGRHEGGYLAFSFDVTEAIDRQGENHLQVRVEDTLSHTYPYGKQRRKRGGMWYTPISGIWQSVWLENVPEQFIEAVKLTPDLQGVELEISGTPAGFQATVKLSEQESYTRAFSGSRGRLDLPGDFVEPWTPSRPRLYELTLEAGADRVETYFALRTVEIREVEGVDRVCLNGKPLFLHGVLDQGYYPEGLYLPAEEGEYARDILRMKELGFNLLRKHAKVEPEAFYCACDRLGMLVMQDMVNSGPYSFLFHTALPTLGLKKRGDRRGTGGRRKEFFRSHTAQAIRQLSNHPCLVAWTLFNEGWGQFHSDEFYELAKALDPTRLVDSASGWFAQEKNDFDSEHIYFKTVDLRPGKRPLLVSECGGYSMPVNGHIYSKYNTYGYGASRDSRELTAAILNLYKTMILPGAPKGVCGCIYTQLSDVEDESNGLYTYDRKVCKVNKEEMQRLARKLQEAVR